MSVQSTSKLNFFQSSFRFFLTYFLLTLPVCSCGCNGILQVIFQVLLCRGAENVRTRERGSGEILTDRGKF